MLILARHFLWKKNFQYLAKNAQHCNKSVDILQQTCYQQADIRMRSHGLRQLVDVKSVASCQQTCCKLIVKTCYPQACYKLFQQVVINLQMKSCKSLVLTDMLKLDKIDKFVGTCRQVGKIDNSQRV